MRNFYRKQQTISDHVRRGSQINIRISDGELVAFKAAAGAAGITLSRWLVELGLAAVQQGDRDRAAAISRPCFPAVAPMAHSPARAVATTRASAARRTASAWR